MVSAWGEGLRGLKRNLSLTQGVRRLGTSVGQQMCVADPRLVSADPCPLVAPHALWGHDALDLTYYPVHSNTGCEMH